MLHAIDDDDVQFDYSSISDQTEVIVTPSKNGNYLSGWRAAAAAAATAVD